MWQNADELIEALTGEYGPEEQAEAMQFADESGLLAQWVADDDAEKGGGYEDALEKEFQRVESQIGRELTPDEEQAMLNNISTQDRHEGVVPDFVSDYGQGLAGAVTHESGRVHIGAAAAERAFEAMGATDQTGEGQSIALEPENPWAA